MIAPLNIAHRGGAALWPENTLFAFRSAAEMGCGGAELDVQLTRDGELAVFHDFTLSPVLCRKDGAWVKPPLAPIRGLSLAELGGFDVGRPKPRSLYARTHRALTPRDGEHIPSLQDVIACVRDVKGFRLFIEIKTSPEHPELSAPPEAAAKAVVALLRRERFLERSVIVGFDWRALIHVKRLEPALACWFTTKRRRARKGVEAVWAGGFDPWKFSGSLPQAIKQAGGDGWFASRDQADAKTIAAVRELGLKVGVWTVNGTRAMKRFAGLGADAICTDRPDRMMELK